MQGIGLSDINENGGQKHEGSRFDAIIYIFLCMQY